MSRFVWLPLFLAPLLALAQSSVPHPRLILDAATLTTLRARANANTPEWQTLKTYCDSFIGGTVQLPDGNGYPDLPDIGQGYQGSDYWSALLGEALCYETMKGINAAAATPYGQKARDVLLAMATPYNGGLGHGQDPCTDNGYGIRFFGVGLGLGYDWAYDQLDTAQKSQVYTTANEWLNTFETNACSDFEYAHPQSNYFAGYFHAKTVIALATAGDNPNAAAEWADWQNAQFNTAAANPPHVGVQPYYATHMTGGGWPEGFGNYGPLATLNMSLPAWEVKTATSTDLIHANAAYTFPLDAADYLMQFTWPTRDYIDDRDTNHATGNPTPPAGSADAGMFMHVLGNLRYWNAPHADVFQAYANAVVAATGGSANEWETFLLWDPNGTTQPITSLPLSYFAPGLNAVAARSDWGASASWMSFRAAPYINNPGQGEEGYDQGSLALVRGNTPLLVNGTGWIVHEPNGDADESRIYTDLYGNIDGSVYSSNRTIYNVFYVRKLSGPSVVDRYGQAAYTAEDFNAQTHVAAFEDGANYVYALATRLEDMYRPDGGGLPQVASWSREIVYLRPSHFVVYDRTSEGAAGDDQFLAFHFAANPAAGSAPSGETRYDVTYNASYAGALTTVLPANATSAIIPMYPANDGVPASSPVKVWQVQLRPPNTNANQLWLNVFDLATTSGAVASASKITVTAGAATGTLLTASGGNEAVLFNTGAAGTTIAGSIGYSVPATATYHCITEVPANARYSVTAVVGSGMHTITVTPGGPLRSTAQGILTFNVSATGTVTPGDRIFADDFGG
jgi:hypothetical protein